VTYNMAKLFVLLGLIALSAALPASNLNVDFHRYPGRIIGGDEAKPHDYPWQVSMLRTGSHICGGSIIDDHWVITAAHCCEVGQANAFSLRSGVHHLSQANPNIQTRPVNRKVEHGSYNGNSLVNDICLLHVATAWEFKYGTAKIALPTVQEWTAEGESSITGWGSVREGGSVSQTLQVVKVPIVTDEYCRAAYSGVNPVTSSMICAGLPEGGKDACQGDSGGPMTIMHNGVDTLVGLTSWGVGCARPNYPGVYTEVSHYLDWIANNTA